MKKAQAAMEFLMTYGFAIIAVIVAIAALSYFGVLTSKTQPRKCTFPAGMDCIDSAVSQNGAIVAIKNNLASGINITDIVPKSCVPSQKSISNSQSPYLPLPMAVGKGIIFKINYTCNYEPNKRLKEDIVISYTNLDSGIPHKVSGELLDYVI